MFLDFGLQFIHVSAVIMNCRRTCYQSVFDNHRRFAFEADSELTPVVSFSVGHTVLEITIGIDVSEFIVAPCILVEDGDGRIHNDPEPDCREREMNKKPSTGLGLNTEK